MATASGCGADHQKEKRYMILQNTKDGATAVKVASKATAVRIVEVEAIEKSRAVVMTMLIARRVRGTLVGIEPSERAVGFDRGRGQALNGGVVSKQWSKGTSEMTMMCVVCDFRMP
ncbi:hypothetical protein FH972_025739 [Carpinus fangiana]|uniref:Uncharacterized protein n=1 Tax=Carpinus fangiana TaxID=176857 RepID=A0A5N6L1V7_9ROSI|nr:hypothetical protein FH972_025739 [Carpinus fangiana]